MTFCERRLLCIESSRVVGTTGYASPACRRRPPNLYKVMQ